jgi:hypothetical protein
MCTARCRVLSAVCSCVGRAYQRDRTPDGCLTAVTPILSPPLFARDCLRPCVCQVNPGFLTLRPGDIGPPSLRTTGGGGCRAVGIDVIFTARRHGAHVVRNVSRSAWPLYGYHPGGIGSVGLGQAPVLPHSHTWRWTFRCLNFGGLVHTLTTMDSAFGAARRAPRPIVRASGSRLRRIHHTARNSRTTRTRTGPPLLIDVCVVAASRTSKRRCITPRLRLRTRSLAETRTDIGLFSLRGPRRSKTRGLLVVRRFGTVRPDNLPSSRSCPRLRSDIPMSMLTTTPKSSLWGSPIRP